jgi:RimJ/RimL family protein N-acetyltransferase
LRRSTIFEFLNAKPGILTGEKVSLRPRSLEDCTNEYRWRTDVELCRLDAAIPVTLSYAEFLDRYSIELEYPGLTHTLAVDTLEGTHIGECSLFNIDFVDSSTEVGIMIGNKDYWGRGFGTDAMKTFLQHIFNASDVEKVLLRTLHWNARAQKCFQKCGFTQSATVTKGEYRFLVMEALRPARPGPA